MGEPYLMEIIPTDGGYASLYMSSFDMLNGCLDGFNSMGLTVSLMALPNVNNKDCGKLKVGMMELETLRFLLDCCADIYEAKQALNSIKTYIYFTSCHYLICDSSGESFIFKPELLNEKRYFIDGSNNFPLISTNHNLEIYPDIEYFPQSQPKGDISSTTFMRYKILKDSICFFEKPFTKDVIKNNHKRVRVRNLHTKINDNDRHKSDITSGGTLWHSVYNPQEKYMEISFYLNTENSKNDLSPQTKYFKFYMNK